MKVVPEGYSLYCTRIACAMIHSCQPSADAQKIRKHSVHESIKSVFQTWFKVGIGSHFSFLFSKAGQF